MNEKERRKFEFGKSYVLTAKLVYGMYLFIAAVSTTALVVSVPSAVLDVLPKWANITLTVSGALVALGSYLSLGKMNTWLRDADKIIKEFETNPINLPVDSQIS